MEKWQDPLVFAIGLGITIFVFIALVGSIIIFTRIYFKRIITEQQKLAEAEQKYTKSLLWNSVLVQEKERNRIAAELHDGLVSKLNVVKLAFKTQSDKIDPHALLEDSIKIARNLSHELSPPFIEQLCLDVLVKEFVEPLNEKYNIKFYAKTHASDYQIETGTKLQLYRIVQEIINNTIKHASATEIDINIRQSKTCISFVISDNGKGFNTKQNKKGLGLKNIELRTRLLKGQCKFKSVEGYGTSFILSLNNDSR